MKTIAITVTVLIFSCCILHGQVPVWEKMWDNRFGGTEDDIITTFHITPDSGIIMFGTSFSGITGDKTQANHDTSLTTSDFWFVKTDSTGSILWDKRYGGTQFENLIDGIVTADGGFLGGGQSYSNISGDKTENNWDTTMFSNDYWVIKTDALGNVSWDKRFGGSLYELFGSVRQLNDGGFLISGTSFSGADGDKTEVSQGGWDYWLIRTDNIGNKIWDKRFGGPGDDFCTASLITSDGNYVVAGYSNSIAGGDKSEATRGFNDYWIIKLDENGVKLWDKTLGGNYNDWLFALAVSPDGGIVAGGQSFSEATGDKTAANHEAAPSGSDRWIVKIDSNGNKIWDKTIGGMATDDVSRIIPINDGGFLISGESYSDIGGDKTEDNLGPEQTWVVKIDSAGIIAWDKTLFTYGHDEAGSAIPWGDECFISVNFTHADSGGYKSLDSWGAGDYWMLKMCIDNSTSLAHIENNSDWYCYPNPVNETIAIYGDFPYGDVNVVLSGVSGKILFEGNFTAGKNIPVKLDASELNAGIYFCRILSEEKVSTIRVVKTE